VDLHTQACKYICSIHEYFKREAENKGRLIPFPKVQDRVAAACGIGKRTLQIILQESRRDIKKCGSTSFVSPRKSRRVRKQPDLILLTEI
jgi:hypothetical protein